MVRRISFSQFNSMVRQAQSKHRNAVRQYNQAVDKHNREMKRRVDDYNREIRAHNTRVRANRSKLENALRSLQSAVRKPRQITYTVTSQRVYDAYRHVDARYESGHYPDRFNEVLDFAEREAANSVALEASLSAEPTESEQEQEFDASPELLAALKAAGNDLAERWSGALFSLSPRNPDAARHFCTSAREIFIRFIDIGAPDCSVLASMPDCEVTSHGAPSRRSKIRFMLSQRSLSDRDLEEFVSTDVENILSLFRTFNDGTHGSAGKFAMSHLLAIKTRVEDGIKFLSMLALPA